MKKYTLFKHRHVAGDIIRLTRASSPGLRRDFALLGAKVLSGSSAILRIKKIGNLI